jgi:hypothetical protein
MPREVTGKKSSPTATHEVRKRLPKWVPVAGRIAGPSCRGGYKDDGLAFQVGGWATGRQHVAVKILTFRKPNLWLRTVTLSGFELGGGKGLMR